MAGTVASPNPLDRRAVADAAFAFVLVGLGAFGFRTSFGGWHFLVVAMVAAGLGLAAGIGVVRYRLTPMVAAAAAVVVLVVCGGIAVPDAAPLGLLPTPGAFHDLADGAANGWARLLTSTAPAGTADSVLVVPYLCAFAGAFLGFLLARLRSRVPWCLVPPIAVLVVSVLLGIKHPANLLLQGGVFAAVGIAWISVRVELRRTQLVGGADSGRVVAALGMLCVVLVAATGVGPHLPGAPPSSSHRVILRDDVVPPFDVHDYASPLVGYRKYLGKALKERELFTVSGLPRNGLLRLAVMDYYDGIVWSVAAPKDARSLASAGVFRHVGPSIPDAPSGDQLHVRIEAAGKGSAPLPTSVWIPSVGAPTSVHFSGPRAEDLRRSFRFNRSTESVATPIGLLPGDVVEIRSVVDAGTTRHPTRGATFGQGGAGGVGDNLLPAEVMEPIRQYMSAYEGQDDAAQAAGLEDLFQQGWYYDPDGTYKVPPGHSLAHLRAFLDNQVDGHPIGDEEQYAAAMAAAARTLGMPARVVVGFRPKVASDGTAVVRGGDATAWVEMSFKEIGWAPFFPTPPRDRTTKDQPKPVLINEVKAQEAKTAVTTPPPHLINLDKQQTDKGKADESHDGLGSLLRWLRTIGAVLGVGLLTIAGPIVLIAAAKGQRRRRRRGRGDPARRLSAAFTEALDLARDAGQPVPPGLTRFEAAQLAGDATLVALAARADQGIFGAADPNDADASAMWEQVDAYRRQLLAGRNRMDRIRFRANPTSLVAGRSPVVRGSGLLRRARSLLRPRLRTRSVT
jgi:transglutaminase-like putative cysteine protease